MSSVPTSNEFAEVWAVPIAERLVALWAVLPQAIDGVSIAIDDPNATLWMRRRVIGSRHRIHLFIYRLQDVRHLSECTLSFRESKDQALRHAAIKPRLPEWRSPGTSAAIRAIIAALDEEGEGEPAPALSQALSTLSAWSVPCLYHGSDEGASVAVFSFVPIATGDITVFTASAGGVRERRLVAVEYDPESSCLLWDGDDLDRAYVDVDGELLELRPEPARGMPCPSPSAWFMAQRDEIQDWVIDGWSRLAGSTGGEGQGPFLSQLPKRRSLAFGTSAFDIRGAFAIGQSVLLCTGTSEDPPGRIELAIGGETPVAMRRAAVAPRDDGSRPVAIYEAPLPPAMFGSAAGRVTVAHGAVARSTWVAIQGLVDVSARRDFHHQIAWETADEGVVAAYADAIVEAGAPQTDDLTPPIINLHGSPGDGPLVITADDGEDTALKATILSVSLGVTGATVRIVHRGRPSLSRQFALRGLCQAFDIHAELVVSDMHEPIGWALRVRRGDAARPAILFCQCGTVPIEVGWWDRLDSIVHQDLAAIHWASPGGAHRSNGAAPLRPAADTLLSGVPLLVAGPRVETALLVPRFDVFSFAGFARQVLVPAEQRGCLRALEGFRLTRFVDVPGNVDHLGDVRIDDAVVEAASRANQGAERAIAAESRLLLVGSSRRQRTTS